MCTTNDAQTVYQIIHCLYFNILLAASRNKLLHIELC